MKKVAQERRDRVLASEILKAICPAQKKMVQRIISEVGEPVALMVVSGLAATLSAAALSLADANNIDVYDFAESHFEDIVERHLQAEEMAKKLMEKPN